MATIWIMELLEPPAGWARHYTAASETLLSRLLQDLRLKHPEAIPGIRLSLDDQAPEGTM